MSPSNWMIMFIFMIFLSMMLFIKFNSLTKFMKKVNIYFKI